MSKEEKKAHKRAREKSGDHASRFRWIYQYWYVLSSAFVVTAAAKASEAAAAKKPKIIIIKKTPKHQPPKKKKMPANPVYKFSLNNTEVSAMEAAVGLETLYDSEFGIDHRKEGWTLLATRV